MTRYKIVVEKEVLPPEGEKYPTRENVYEQKFEAEDDDILEAIIKAVNQFDA